MRPPLYDHLVQRLAVREPFAFSRWGDGEWACVLGDDGRTCDGQTYTPALRADLVVVLERRPSYLLGLQPLAQRLHGARIKAWLAARGLHFEWVDADVFAQASIRGELDAFIAALKPRPVILVGPERLAGVGELVPLQAHVWVPLTNAHASLDHLLEASLEAVRWLQGQAPVVLVSAGPAANLLVDRLHALVPDITAIDVGSIWEPYLGLSTRTYHARVRARLA